MLRLQLLHSIKMAAERSRDYACGHFMLNEKQELSKHAECSCAGCGGTYRLHDAAYVHWTWKQETSFYNGVNTMCIL